MNTSSGIDFIVNSKRSYPEWLRTHAVFKNMNKIDKIFPKIGLSNFKEPCEISNSEAKKVGSNLGYKLENIFAYEKGFLITKLYNELKATDKDRNERCSKIQTLINLLVSVKDSMSCGGYIKSIDNKVVLQLNHDIFGSDKRPFFREGESIIRVAGKLIEMINEIYQCQYKIEHLTEFKEFSRVNMPINTYKIHFSSDGEEGAWDMATISMRGIKSCQAWTAPQSRGLIGSISSKFVGVIFLTSSTETEIAGYGSKMLHRCVVRFTIHVSTKKPVLALDTMYPALNNDVLEVFKKSLKTKSGLDTIYLPNGGSNNYYLPEEPSRKFLHQGEFSYMDHPLAIANHGSLIKTTNAGYGKLTSDFRLATIASINKQITFKREAYSAAEKQLATLTKEFLDAKSAWEKENADKPEADRKPFELTKPVIDIELVKFARGNGKKDMLTFLGYMDRKIGKNCAVGLFVSYVLDNITVATNCASDAEYHRQYILEFMRKSSQIKAFAWQAISKGMWMKSFPKCSEKFFNQIFTMIKGYMLASAKELIKKSN